MSGGPAKRFRPQLGTEAWNDFCNVWAAIGERRLSDADYRWLHSLFCRIHDGVDVREYFLVRASKARAPDDWTLWIAIDAAYARRGRDPDQADTFTARKWCLRKTTVAQYVREHNTDLKSFSQLFKNPAFEKVIDRQRSQLLEKRKLY